MAKLATCKRCGSTAVSWVKSKRTGKWYLAFARQEKSFAVYGPDSVHRAGGGVSVAAHIPHDCDDPARGGRPLCDLCGKRCGSRGGMLCKSFQRGDN